MTARILALFIGLFIAINLLGNVVAPGFDANAWWIHFSRWLPAWLAKSALTVSAIAMIAFAFRNRLRRQRSRVTAVLSAGLAIITLINTISFYWLLTEGRIDAGFPLPLSLV